METVVIALGSNLGDRYATLRFAARELRSFAVDGNLRASPVIETAAMTLHGVDRGRPAYLNQVVELRTALTLHELFRATQDLETRFGRKRCETWGDRTLDVDLICFGTVEQSDPTLTLPHPRAHERDFVLAPWSQVDPAAVLPGHGPVVELLRRLRYRTVALDALDALDAPGTTDEVRSEPTELHTWNDTDSKEYQ